MRLWFSRRHYGGCRYQNKAPPGQSLSPLGDAVDGEWIEKAGARGGAVHARLVLELGQLVVDLHGGLNRIDRGRGLCERRPSAGGDVRNRRPGRDTIVEEQQTVGRAIDRKS